MNKQMFLNTLRDGLSGLPQADIEDRLSFYGEMIDDAMEDGLTEEEAVKGIGSVGEVIAQVMAEVPLSRLIKERVRPKRAISSGEIVLLILGSPLWLPLLIALWFCILVGYIVMWSFIVALWAIDLAAAACALGCVVAAGICVGQTYFWTALAFLGGALASTGVAILFYFVCLWATKAMVALSRKMLMAIKLRLIGRKVAS